MVFRDKSPVANGIIFTASFRNMLKSFTMSSQQTQSPSGAENASQRAADTGNASNPSPQNESLSPAQGLQLLDEKAEKYLREVANIEDVPDAQDQEEMDKTLSDEH